MLLRFENFPKREQFACSKWNASSERCKTKISFNVSKNSFKLARNQYIWKNISEKKSFFRETANNIAIILKKGKFQFAK